MARITRYRDPGPAPHGDGGVQHDLHYGPEGRTPAHAVGPGTHHPDAPKPAPTRGSHGGSGEPLNPNAYTSPRDEFVTKARMREQVPKLNRQNKARIDYANSPYGKARAKKKK